MGEDQLKVGLTVGGLLEDCLEEFEAIELESWLLGGHSDCVLDEGGEEGLIKKVHYAFEEVVEVVQLLSTYPGKKAAAFLQVSPQNIGDETLVCPLVVYHCENDSHFLQTQGWLIIVKEILERGGYQVEEDRGSIGAVFENGAEE